VNNFYEKAIYKSENNFVPYNTWLHEMALAGSNPAFSRLDFSDSCPKTGEVWE
jgi:hypothetical protein